MPPRFSVAKTRLWWGEHKPKNEKWWWVWFPAVPIVGMLRPWEWANAYPPTGDWVGHLSTLNMPMFHAFVVDWWGGHPMWYFYFPFPFWLFELGGEGPLVVKAVAMLPVVFLPPAVWLLARTHQRTRGESVLWACFTSAYVLSPISHREGGYLLSALVGEFAYSWSLLAVVLYLAASRSGRNKTAAAMLTIAALSHPIPAAVAGLISIRRWKTWLPAVALTAWWWVPALLRVQWANSRHQTPIEWPWENHGGDWWLWILAAVALVGMYRAVRVVPPKNWAPFWFGWWPFLFFLAQGQTGLRLPLWNGRVRPLFILVMFWLVASAMWWLITALFKHNRDEWAAIVGIVLIIALVFHPAGWRNHSLRMWQLNNDTGHTLSNWENMPQILKQLGELERSIVAVEYHRQMPYNRLSWDIPRLTDQRFGGGIYLESASSAPFWLITITQLSKKNIANIWGHSNQYPAHISETNPEKGIAKARDLGARWLILTRTTARTYPKGLIDPIWEGNELGLYDTGATALHKIATPPPNGLQGHELWEWWNTNAGAWAKPASNNVTITDREIVFETGTAHITYLIAVSCFPGWELQTPGQTGCSPTNQLTVTPTTTGTVQLTWSQPPTEKLGWAITILSLIGWGAHYSFRRSPAPKNEP